MERTQIGRSEQINCINSSAQWGGVVFMEATVSTEWCERGCTNGPPIGGIYLLIEDDETGPRRSNPLTEQRNPLIKCK